MLVHIAYGRDTDLRELLRLNRHKEGAPFVLGPAMAAASASPGSAAAARSCAPLAPSPVGFSPAVFFSLALPRENACTCPLKTAANTARSQNTPVP